MARRRDQGRARARQAVRAQMSARRQNVSDLARRAGVDPGTLADFLSGTRWPNIKSQGHIEQAVGWPPGTLNDIAVNGATPPEIVVPNPLADPSLGQINDDEHWIWDRTEIPVARRRALVVAYRSIKALDPDNGTDNGTDNGADNASDTDDSAPRAG